MATARLDTEKFTGKNDFGLWRIKMKAVLIQQGLVEALRFDAEAKLDANADDKTRIKKQEMQDRAHSTIIMCLGDKVLREVAKEKTIAEVWAKLESLYMAKSLANRLFMKQKLCSYRFLEDKGIEKQLEEFNKAVDDLKNIDVSLADEDKAILLLNALPKSFDHLRDAMLYGREKTITLEEVQSVLRAKPLQKSSSKMHDTSGEVLSVKKFKGKKNKPNFNSNKPQSYKTKEGEEKETRKCHWCKKLGHLKRNCYVWKKKQASKNEGENSADLAKEFEFESAEILNVVQGEVSEAWIMDSGCTFHMCPHKCWFEDLEDASGSVLLGNNQVCDIKGIGKIRLKMHDRSFKILSEVRYIPDLKRNLVSWA